MTDFKHIAVYGGGSWGTALAAQIARRQKQVMLFLRDANIIHEISNHNTNEKYLGDIKLPSNIHPSDDFLELSNQEVIVIAIPSNHIVDFILKLKELPISPSTHLLIATKGLCKDPTELISDRIKSLLPNKIAFIGGPNFAKEVAEGLLTAATVASEDINLANALAKSIETENFQVSTTDDIITTQIAGIVKNIIAIECGIYEGMGYKENAKAALITNGMQEIASLSQKLGGKLETILQPLVLGDLVLTCYSKTSRNTKFGYEFAKAADKKQFLENYSGVVEGRESAKLIMDLIERVGLDLPVITSIARKLNIKGL